MPGLNADGDGGDRQSLVSVQSVKPSSDSLTKLVGRLRALTLRLLPVEVAPEDISAPTSRVITPEVISAYTAAAGDFVEALPYCLLRARAEFLWDAQHNPADYDEDYGRAVACEVLARRIVHKTAPDRLNAIMSTRYKHKQIDGDDSDPCSALEMAIDTHATIFLSSTESQDVVKALWVGDIVQKSEEVDVHEIDYIPYSDTRSGSFWDHLDPSRLSVPRSSSGCFFLLAYSQAVRQPVERLTDPTYDNDMDAWEVVLYTLALSIIFEDVHKFFKLLRFVTWRAFSFWNVVAIITDSLLLAAFILRVIGIRAIDEKSTHLRVTSFQVLSFVSPLIWMSTSSLLIQMSESFDPMTLLNRVDHLDPDDAYRYVGMMQICVARMLQESGIFFALLSILGLGFAQAMYALDAADGTVAAPSSVVNSLIQGLLGSPDFTTYDKSPSGLLMYYLWNIVTLIILLNVLISLFSSAYDDVVGDAEAQFLAFFAGKTVGMIRAPDSYVYPAPFNLVEMIFVSPFEYVLSERAYASLNRFVMRIMFFIPLTLIALSETFQEEEARWVKNWLSGDNQGDDNYDKHRDPEPSEDDARGGLSISKVPFAELVKVFPNTAQSTDTLMMLEIKELKAKLDKLMEKLDA
ncbi:hypothetical protein D9758_004822 [Tetrapyrgos nigripes]|uniref:Calcium activated cation channel n=1 Tax=Tetrapyrgos nigripes TaxID=182062 RepID=A0A8H5G5Q9_9AGAR|nr:hypothetical protein D9758_004822 [Tetrapyrgos nigripes]